MTLTHFYPRTSQFFMFALAIVAICCSSPLSAQTPTFISFDAPNAGTGVNQGTLAGHITGYYYDPNGAFHGFVQ